MDSLEAVAIDVALRAAFAGAFILIGVRLYRRDSSSRWVQGVALVLLIAFPAIWWLWSSAERYRQYETATSTRNEADAGREYPVIYTRAEAFEICVADMEIIDARWSYGYTDESNRRYCSTILPLYQRGAYLMDIIRYEADAQMVGRNVGQTWCLESGFCGSGEEIARTLGLQE